MQKTITKSSSRMDKAQALVQSVRKNENDGGGSFSVPSSSFQIDGSVYKVSSFDSLGNIYSCTCADYQHRGGDCKHILAVRLYKEGYEMEQQEQKQELAKIAKESENAQRKGREELTKRFVDDNSNWVGGFD